MIPTLELEQPIARIRLRRPAVANKLAPEDLPVLIEHLNEINRTDGIKVVLLESEGKYFCSGYDISEVGGSQTEGSSFGEMVDAFEQCRAITVAVIHGGVYGGATDSDWLRGLLRQVSVCVRMTNTAMANHKARAAAWTMPSALPSIWPMC